MGRKSYSEDLSIEEAAKLEQEREDLKGLFGQTLPPMGKQSSPIAQGPMLPSNVQDMEETVITASPLKYSDIEQPKTVPPVQETKAPLFTNPIVAEHLAKKVLGDDYSPERLKDIVAQAENRAANPGLLIAQAFQGFGDSLARRNPAQSMDTFDGYRKDIRKNAIDDFERGRKVNKEQIEESRTNDLYDPNSDRSISFRKSMEELYPKISQAYGDTWKNVTAQDHKIIFDPVKLKLEMDARQEKNKIDAQNAASFARQRSDNARDRAAEKAQARIDKMEKEARLEPKQMETITDLDNAESDLNNLLASLGQNKAWTGPVDGRVPDMFVGDDQVAWRSAVGKYKDAYRKAITGAGAGPTEIAMLERRLPSENDQFDNFRSKANEALGEIQRRKSVYLNNLAKVGKSTSEFGANQANEPVRTLKKKQYSKSANKTKLIYSDGSEEIVDGQR